MNLDRVTRFEEGLLTDACLIVPQAVTIKDGVPAKTAGAGIPERCLVCSDSARDDANRGLYENIPVFYVKLPKERSLNVGDTIIWKERKMTVTRTNRDNTRRVLTVAECQGQNG